ncbi:MAG: DUF499 domain-containing protein [Thermoplasmata archaeon]|nr:DUF499 domain-containing protein [Thermoplasmata archaeon]
MKPFHTIAVPHKDILEGNLTMDVFAADLWEVNKDKGPDEYRDADLFFKKTYMTEGLKSLLDIVEKRLKGTGGHSVIQIQTPFGGGKTHALIAMLHKAESWGAKTVVFVGDKVKTGSKAEDFDTPWKIMEYQLTGKVNKFKSPIPPGGEQIKELLEQYKPTLILIDEFIPYLNIADSVKVEKSTLTSLILSFMHTLTNVVSEMPGVSLVFTTTPSNPYNRTPRGQEIVSDLQNITARKEIIKTPVDDHEITAVIRQRLFAEVNKDAAKKIISEFIKYCEKENILPAGVEPSDYRDKFIESYPFTPEVIDVLYHRWGSYPDFQRTRGVLRLLSLVIHSLKGDNISYISVADFDLGNQDIRQELLKHIGQEFNGIIAGDITDYDAGAKKVDTSLGGAYQGLKLGTRSATTIFMYSFSGGAETGATTTDIKRLSTTVENPSSVIAEVLDQLKTKHLGYLQYGDEKYFFQNQPNLLLILRKKWKTSSPKILSTWRKSC